jgi:hypothetical protein
MWVCARIEGGFPQRNIVLPILIVIKIESKSEKFEQGVICARY